jgi:hypothetical protein
VAYATQVIQEWEYLDSHGGAALGAGLHLLDVHGDDALLFLALLARLLLLFLAALLIL